MRPATSRLTFVVLLAAAASPPWARAGAQVDVTAAPAAPIPGVAPGSRVRVWLPEARRQKDGPLHRLLLRATVEALDADSLRLRIPSAQGTLAVARRDIRRLDVSRGPPSRAASAVERGIEGAIGGALLAVLVNSPHDDTALLNERTSWRAAGVGAAWGGGVGALIGLIWPHERWRRVLRGAR